jgi:hypothetical protein
MGTLTPKTVRIFTQKRNPRRVAVIEAMAIKSETRNCEIISMKNLAVTKTNQFHGPSGTSG